MDGFDIPKIPVGKTAKQSFDWLNDNAEPVFDALVGAIASRGIRVETGRFGARMAVELTNDGPVTLVIEVAPEATVG